MSILTGPTFFGRVATVSLFCATLVATYGIASAEERFEDLLKRAQDYKEQGRYRKALDELGWAQKQLELLHGERLQSFFPAAVGDFQGGKFDNQSMIGLVSVSRDYVSPSAGKIKVALVGAGAGTGAAQQGLGALAGLAGAAAMFGNPQQVETMQIKGVRAMLDSKTGKPELTLPLSSGMIIQIRPQGGKATKEQLVSVAEAIDFKGLESYVTAQ